MKRLLAIIFLLGLVAGGSVWGRPLWRSWRLNRVPQGADVLLVTLDTTRADRLGCYGYQRGATPHLDALAQKGIVFENAYAHVPLTCPSHASIMTGVIPARHGVHDNGGFVLGDEYATLAEQFVKAGYRTGGFVSAFVLDRRFGIARGFATYDDNVLEGGRDNIHASISAKLVVDRTVDWLTIADPRPTFTWVHLYEPHNPWEPPEPYATVFKNRPYDGEIAYMDSEIGRLLAIVEARGRPTLIAVLGDHGESLGQHGELTHTYFIYSSTQHVPFILSWPGYLPEGLRLAPLVRGVDLMPTLLEIAGLGIPEGIDGRSLVPLITGWSDKEPGPVYLETYFPRFWWGAKELLGIRTTHWLYIRSPRPEIYRVDQDPQETRNLLASEPQKVAELDAVLTQMVGNADPAQQRTAMDPEVEARLRSLGYAGGGIEGQLTSGEIEGQLTSGELPDAKDNRDLLAGFTKGQELMEKEQFAEALQVFQETLKINPRSTSVRARIANILVELKRYDEAFEAFGDLVIENPDYEGFHIGMARSRLEQGNPAEALALARHGLERIPESSLLHETAAVALNRLGQAEEAEAQIRQAVALAPRQVGPRVRLGAILAQRQKRLEASATFQAAVDISPHSKEAKEAAHGLNALGETFLLAGNAEEAYQAYRAAARTGVSNEGVYLNFALASYRVGRVDEAVGVLQNGVAELPESANLHYRLGRLLQGTGKGEEAEQALRRCLELEAGRSDATWALGAVLETLGKTGEARQAYEAVVRGDPSSEYGRRARESLSRLRGQS